jgi:PAS domain S-box-containing protein
VRPIGPAGAPSGVLAVIDERPRAWSPSDLDALEDHAAMAADILERRRTDALHALALRDFPGAVTAWDNDLRLKLAAGQDLVRYGFTDLAGKTLSEALDPRLSSQYEAVLREALRGVESAREVGYDAVAYDVRASPLRGADGAVTGALLTLHDVNARVAALAAADALAASEQRYQQLFAKAGEAIYVVDAGDEHPGAILEANAAAAQMYGYSVDELERMTEAELKAPEDQDVTARRIHRIGGVNWIQSEAVHQRKDGTRFPVAFSAGPLDVGPRRCVLTFARDITESRRTEHALRDATRAADAASRAKSAFLANMSHEIRTPLNAVLGYTQLLHRDPRLGDEQRQQLEVIERSGEQLLALINDVLELSKLEVGHRKQTREDVDLAALLDDVEETFAPRAAAKRLSFDLHRDAHLPRAILGDASKLRQVFVNLVGNAVKFTERGSIAVRVAHKRSARSEGRLVVEVEDTGPGISPDKLGGLFQPFAQVRVGNVAQGGTGLGLALSRELARVMGGDVTVKSTTGEGSVFRFEAPAPPTSTTLTVRPLPRGPVVAVAAQAGLVRILIVDEDDADRSWMRRLLERIGFDVQECASGIVALAAFPSYRPHLVLVDAHASAASGASALRAFRELPAGRKTALVALVPPSPDDGRDSLVEGGADGVLRKPVREAELLDEIRKQIGIDYSYGEVVSPRPTLLPGSSLGVDSATLLPRALRADLLRAARIADYDWLMDLIANVPLAQADLGAALRALVEAYAYEAIEQLLSGP